MTVNTDDGRVAATRVAFGGAVVHTAVAPAIKAPLLKHFGIRRVPHMVVLNTEGSTLRNGAAVSLDELGELVGVRAEPAAAVPELKAAPSTPAFSMDEDF